MEKKMYPSRVTELQTYLYKQPVAKAKIEGSVKYPDIEGMVRLYQTRYGVLVAVEVFGLPKGKEECSERIFAVHIHEGMKCSGNEMDMFADVMAHYNPKDCKHPYHAGDFPPLFENNGYSFSIFLTDRFTINEIIGRTIIIHDNPDDFTTQPSGKSGEKIACGKIEKNR